MKLMLVLGLILPGGVVWSSPVQENVGEAMVVDSPVLILETGTSDEIVDVDQVAEPVPNPEAKAAEVRSIGLRQLSRAVGKVDDSTLFLLGELADLQRVVVDNAGRPQLNYTAVFRIREVLAHGASVHVHLGRSLRVQWAPRAHHLFAPHEGAWLMSFRQVAEDRFQLLAEDGGRRHWPIRDNCLAGWGVCLEDIRTLVREIR